MALSTSSTVDDITTAVKALNPNLTGASETQFRSFMTAIIGALFTRIKADMQVSSTVTVASVTGVTSGGGTSGPGTGTAVSSSVT